MNDDTIYRQAAIDIVEFECGKWRGLAKTIIEEIGQLPSARPKGRWETAPDRTVHQTFDECKCSACGAVEYFNKGWKKFNFCPNCGADMRETE